MVENVDFYKFIIIGSSGVGKTCVLKRFTDNNFISNTLSTTGVVFETVEIPQVLNLKGEPVKLQVWDTAGQERFRSISRAYFRNALGVLLIFSLIDKSSFEDVNSWINDARQLCCQDVEITLIGNKSDLVNDRQVSTSEAEEFAKAHNIKYLETSAKSGSNIRESFITTVKAVVDKMGKRNSQLSQQSLKPIQEPEKKSCC